MVLECNYIIRILNSGDPCIGTKVCRPIPRRIASVYYGEESWRFMHEYCVVVCGRYRSRLEFKVHGSH